MKEILTYIKKADWSALFVTPTKNNLLQAFRYVFVGGIAFVADWGTLAVLTLFGLHYLIATVIAFLVGLTVNYLLSKAFVFQAEQAPTGAVGEFIVYALIGAAGLAITAGLMYCAVELAHMHPLVAKCVIAVIILAWNFFMRKILLYRRKEQK